MKMTKLLAGVAVAAILGGAASAQTISPTVANIDGNAGNDLAGLLVGGEYEISNELNFAAALPTNTLEFWIQPNAADAFVGGAAVAADITITLTGGATFSSNITNANFVTRGGSGCAVTFKSGGAAGSQSVVFTTTDIRECDDEIANNGLAFADDDLAGFSLPLLLTGGDANFSVAITNVAAGSSIAADTYDADGNAANGDQDLIDSVSSFTYFADRDDLANGPTVDAGATVTASDSQISLATSYNTLVNATGAGTPGLLGAIFVSEDGNVDFAGTAADFDTAAQVTGVDFTVTLGSTAGLASIVLTGNGGGETITIPVVQGTLSYTRTLAGGPDAASVEAADLLSGINVSLTPDTDTATAISEQTVTVSVAADYPTLSRLTDESFGPAGLDPLTRQGTTSNLFEWVGDTTQGTQNIFRFTGLGATVPTIRMTVSNSSAGNNAADVVLTPSGTLNNGELIVTAADIQAAVGGAFGRADVRFNVEASGVTVRRFLYGANGTLTDMGDDNG